MNSKTPQKKPQRLEIGQSWSFISMIATKFAQSTEVIEDPVVQKFLGHLRSRSMLPALDLADSMGSQTYKTPWQHFVMNQLAQLIRKVPFIDPNVNPEQSAMTKFFAAEHSCKRINQRLLAERRVNRFAHDALRQRARTWIRRVIGETPDLKKIYELCNFGPGASVGVHGTATHLAAKLCSEKWSVTPASFDFAYSSLIGDDHVREYLLGDPRYADHGRSAFRNALLNRVEFVEANKIITVPKTARVHRTIAIEPLLNGYVQHGIDEFLKKKLLRVGINLTDQTRNQALAYSGSLGGRNPYATIDLSSASDSIAIQTAKDLLPPDWFDFLNATRSSSYLLGDSQVACRYEKISSMGNGFCFPLESLIFASLAYSVGVETGDTHFSVYGDDIIVRQSAALYLLEILKFYGFRANTEKTFIIGPFRESCGADFFEGINVRPYSLDFIPQTTRDLFKVHNGLRSHPFSHIDNVLDSIRQMVPSRERFVRPYEGPPDSCFTVGLDVFMASPHSTWNRGYQTWSWKELLSASIADDRRAPAPIQMYGLLRGHRAKHDGQTEYALRRKSRTSVRIVPSRSSRT